MTHIKTPAATGTVVKRGRHMSVFILFCCSALLLPFFSIRAAEETLRIGYQKSSTLFILLKNRGELEEALRPLGVRVEWHEFTSGLPMLEGVNVGALDLSADVGDTVPLFALAAGANIIYFLQERPSPSGQAIIVPADSPIQTVSDLAGKTLAVSKASGAHYLTLAALARAGLKFNQDVKIAYLQPADARMALGTGGVDAWAIWDPFLSAVLVDGEARVLADGVSENVEYRRFYLVSSTYARSRANVLRVVADALIRVGAWVRDNPGEAAKTLAPIVGMSEETVALGISHRSYDVAPVDATALAEQRKIADALVGENLLPESPEFGGEHIWKEK